MISPLQLDGYLIESLALEVNTAFDRRDEISGTLDVVPEHYLHKEEPDTHQLELKVSFGLDDEDPASAPYTGHVAGRAFFHLQADGMSEEEKARLVLLNGGAILYGLLRAQVAQVTALGRHGAFLLPPVNLVEAFRSRIESASEVGSE